MTENSITIFAYFVTTESDKMECDYGYDNRHVDMREITPEIHAVEFLRYNGGVKHCHTGSFTRNKNGEWDTISRKGMVSGRFARDTDNGFVVDIKQEWWDALPKVKS
jgi:hypothetical protein